MRVHPENWQNNEQDLLVWIERHLDQFSKGQRRIGEYLLAHYDKAAFMTAAKLGSTVGVSESTVVRFATEIGFDGYPSFQKDLESIVRNRLTTVQRIQAAEEQIGDDVLTAVLNMEIEQIRKTLESTSRQDFNHAVQLILEAKHIYIIGNRSAQALAGFLSFYLNLIRPGVKFANADNAGEMFEQIMRINEQDLLIGISFPRYSKRTMKAFQYAKDRGSQVIAITDSPASPLAENADCLLLAQSGMTSFVDSLSAPMSLVNALIVAVGTQTRDELYQTFEKLETIWDEYDVYTKFEPK